MSLEKQLENWLWENNIPNVSVCRNLYSGFDIDAGTIKVSTAPMPQTDLFFQQFFYEYSDYIFNLRADTLRFLHEVGHAMTISNFDDLDLFIFKLTRDCNDGLEGYEAACAYWESPEEFAANMWLINFIFNNFEDALRLDMIFKGAKIYAT